MYAVSAHQTRFSPKCFPIVYEVHIVFWAPPRQPEPAAKNVITGRIGQGSRENYRVWHCFGEVACWFNIHFSDLWLAKSGVISANMNNKLAVVMLILQIQIGFNVAPYGPRNTSDRWRPQLQGGLNCLTLYTQHLSWTSIRIPFQHIHRGCCHNINSFNTDSPGWTKYIYQNTFCWLQLRR